MLHLDHSQAHQISHKYRPAVVPQQQYNLACTLPLQHSQAQQAPLKCLAAVIFRVGVTLPTVFFLPNPGHNNLQSTLDIL